MAVDEVAQRGCDVHDLSESHLAETSRLHERSLADGFFAQLGRAFLREYHRTFVDSPHALALGVSSNGRLEGFLLAVLAPQAHGADVLRRRGLALGIRGTLALGSRPGVLIFFVRTRARRYVRALWRRRRRCDVLATSAPAGEWAVLSHVAVDDAARRGGRGALLVRALHDRAAAAGAVGVVLVTDPDGPGPGFYRRLGYDDGSIVVGSDERQWMRFRKRLR